MTDFLPLLVFPQARIISPPKGRGFPAGQPHVPAHEEQVQRLDEQLYKLQQDFARYKADVNPSMAGFEPETVLVIEIAGSVAEFRQAVEAAGLEWLGEWELDDIPPNNDFFVPDNEGKRTDKPIGGRMFLSLGNEAGMQEILSLWGQWRDGKTLPHGKGKWTAVFNQMIQIRRWGIEEVLRETGMLDLWRDMLDPVDPRQTIRCQLELFYRKAKNKRIRSEQQVRVLVEAISGRLLGDFIDMPEIAFHAVKIELPAQSIRQLLAELDNRADKTTIQLFKCHEIMYFRPTGQSLAVIADGEGIETEISEGEGTTDLPIVAAILDGAPNMQHLFLQNRLLLDDPDNLASLYQPGEKKHGTAMASLVVHGDMGDSQSGPLPRLVYVRPVMQPDPHSDPGNRVEHIPDNEFFEDRILRAVRRMFDGEGTVPPQAKDVRVINLSIGDPTRPFVRTPSPWARLLDWLAWKYRVLFCVSAGNYTDSIDISLPVPQHAALLDEEKSKHMLKCIEMQLSGRRVLSPAESINAITVGALHSDSSGNTYYQGRRTDLLPHATLFSPISRLGYGFRRAIKPEIFFPGGRQLYQTPPLDSHTVYKPAGGLVAPGQKVAWDSNRPGSLKETAYTCGTSNAAALATRGAARIYEVIDALRQEHGEERIPTRLIAVLIKALLVHGAKQDDIACNTLTDALKTADNSRRFKEIMARYLGYGTVDIERVLACTAQRGTVVGCGEIRDNEMHEYRLPLPPDLAGQKLWRRMVVTLAWFSPVNAAHRAYREAKLELSPVDKWGDSPLRLARKDADYHQVLRGTVQHEVIDGTKQIAAFQDGDSILLRVVCKKDATPHLDDAIPYGLAVTLEVAEGTGIQIYESIQNQLQVRI